MDKAAAQKLVRETLQGSFNKERFVSLIKNMLNHVEEAPFTYKGQYIFDDFRDSIKRVERIGKYKGSDEKLFDILVIHLQKETSLERARTKQRNFVAKYLKGSRGGVLKDAALVAFVAPDGEDWRFSFIKMDYKFNEKGKIKEEFTSARRYSFLVGKNENSHTAQSRLLPILLNDEVNPTLEELEEIFSIERVTKEFFEKYRDLFLRLEESLAAVLKKDAKVKTDFKAKNVHAVDFAKKLLGQIVFLYFLQKKGWFGVQRGYPWGSGSKHFLRELFNKQHGDYKNFFNDILEPLFYEALRLERPADYYKHFDCRIPFLNGGLFDPLNDYDWVETEILLPDDLFSNDLHTKEGDVGDGILDVFDRYNFTVKEDEPLEKEVAVDPEMLGKVFENLLEIKNRKSKGTYYTPREIVHYMCQESLIEYLYGEFNRGMVAYETIGDDQMTMFGNESKKEQLDLAIGHHQRSLIDKKDIETLIRYGESIVEHERRVVSEGRETDRYAFKLPERIRANALLIDEKLAGIRVCDPAVGSGAFVVGMMNEIIRARDTLTPHIDENDKRTPYDFKRHAIQNCLYGVDIDSGAIEIAKLRLWLSLVVEEEERESIQPLPNLDYKIVCGNSLLDVNKLFNHESLKKLEALKPLYFNETSAGKKQKHKKQIDDLISQMTNGHKDFDFEVYFSEVFHEKKGFDVVIENPPYVRVDDLEKSLKDKYKKDYKTSVGKYDLYYLFFEKSFALANQGGACVFISPNKFCAADSASKLRGILINIIDSGEIISTSRIKVFSEASNYPIISILSKIQVGGSFLVRQVEKLSQLDKKYSVGKYYSADRTDFGLLPKQVIPININQFTFNLLKRLYVKRQIMSEYLSVSEGLRIPSKMESEARSDLKIVKQYQFSKYSSIEDGSFISRKNFGKVISRRSDRHSKIFSPKILIAEDALQISATLDLDELVPQGGVYFATPTSNTLPIKFALGLLNSRLLSYVYEALYAGMHMGGGYLRYRSKFLESLPVPEKIIADDMGKIGVLVDKILTTTKDGNYLEKPAKQAKVREYEKQIDQLVYGLYGLTTEEISAVESQ